MSENHEPQTGPERINDAQMKDSPRSIYRFEIVRHTVQEPGARIHRPTDMISQFQFMETYDREHIVRVDLNGAHETVGYETICIGTDNMSPVGPKEVFRGALLSGASAIILIHNHPSGQTSPSREDQDVAIKIQSLGILLDLQLLDFLIIGRSGNFYSFSEHDLI